MITPSYNQGEFIEETIQSVVNQRYSNLEYFVMDGGSTDQTREILERYQGHFTHWVSEKDGGQTNAINKALERATGDIVAVLNSDDVLLPGALDFVSDQFSKDPSMNWMTAPSLYWGPDRAARTEIMPVYKPSWKGQWLVGQCIPHPSTFVRRELIEKYGPFDEDCYFAMDHEYWCRLAFGGEDMRVFQRPLSGYRLHGTSKTMSMRDKLRADLARTKSKYLPRLSPGEVKRFEKDERYFLALQTLTPTLDYLRRGDREGAKKAWQEQVAENPSVKYTRWWWSTGIRIALNWI